MSRHRTSYLLSLLLVLGGASGALAATPPDGWSITLDASAPGLTDKAHLTLGASSAASNGLDSYDDPHPPALPSRYVDLVTRHSQTDPGWGAQALPTLRYRGDYGAPLGTQDRTIDFFLGTNPTGPVTVTWSIAPDLDLAEHFLTLRDVETGATADMWAQSSYAVPAGTASYRLRIEISTGRTAPPVAYNQAVTTPEDTPLGVTLTAADPKGLPLTYSIVDPAAHGTLLGLEPKLTYVPEANYNGADVFTFQASSGQTESNVAKVTVNVTPVNDAPLAQAQSVTTDENAPVSIALLATDLDADPLTYQVVTQPQHGTLSGTAPSLSYTPTQYYFGSDSFAFKANDGKLDSNLATVSITVDHVNQAPLVNFTVPGPAFNAALWRNNIASFNEGATIVSSSGQLNASWVAQNAIDDAYNTGWGVALPGPASFVLQLPRGEVDHFDRIRLVVYNTANDVNRFEVHVSTTTTDASAFTKVYAGATQATRGVQEFVLPAAVDARYVKFVALDNHGGTFIDLDSLELIRSDKAGLPSYSESNVASLRPGATLVSSAGSVSGYPATQAVDNNAGTIWYATQSSSPSFTVELAGGQSYPIDRVRLIGVNSTLDVKRFQVAVSNTTSDPASFATVLDGTAQTGSQLQEFVFPGGAVDARYVKLVVLSNYGNAYTQLAEFEVVAPDATLSSYGGPYGVSRPENMLMEGGYGYGYYGWFTADRHTSNEFVKVALVQGGQLIDRVRIQQPSGLPTDGPKDFEIRISTSDLRDSSFTTVLTATAAKSPGQIQEFVFPGGAVRAKYVELFVKTNYGSTQDIAVQWFQAVTVESQSNAVSYPAPASNALRLGSPAAVVNGGKVVAVSSATIGSRIDQVLGYGYYYGSGFWQTTSKTGQYLTIELAGGKTYTLRGARIGPHGSSQAVKDFEVWVSTTTTDAAAFTKAFAGTVANNATEQAFLFPPAQARYVKYVPLSNYGDPTSITTVFFDVVADEVPGVVDSTPPSANSLVENGIANSGYPWSTPSATNQWIKVNLGPTQKVYGVRISASYAASPRDFDVRVSTTTPDDAAFTTVFSGTVQQSYAVQTFLFPSGLPDAKYVQFFFKNGYSTFLTIYDLEVLTATTLGANVTAYSSAGTPVENALDAYTVDVSGWQTAYGQVTNQWFTILLPQGRLWTIDHVALESFYPSFTPRDFEIQVSATTQDASAFTTAFLGTMHNDFTHFNGTLQHFFFAPVQARYVKLLVRNAWGSNYIYLKAFRVFSPEIGSANARFLDRSVDVDGQVVSRGWDLGDGAVSNLQDPAHTYAGGRTYNVTLSAADNEGAVGALTRGYRALGPPTADFTWAPSPPAERQWFTLTDTGVAGEGDIVLREWNFGDGYGTYAYTTPTANYWYLDSGDYTVTLRVTDRWGYVATKSKVVSVLNLPPLIVMPSARVAINGILTTFKPNVTDQGGDPFTCVWDFGDGSAPTGPSADCTFTHTYVIPPEALPQAFTATLTATDKDGGVATASVATSVRQPCLAGPKGTAQKAVSGTLYYSRHHVDTDTFNVKKVAFSYDGTAFTLGTKTGIAQLPWADGLFFAPDGDIVVGGRQPVVYKVNPATGTYTSVTTGGVSVEHVNLDPDRKRFWGSDTFDSYYATASLAEFPLDPAFGNGTPRTIRGDDTSIATVSFDGCGNGYYTHSTLGNGPFGLIDMTSFTTGSAGNYPAAHGIAYDPLTATLFLFGSNHITQIDPKTLAVVSDRTFPGDQVGYGIDQGAVDGKGHAFVATTGTNLIFVDYSATGKVGDPSSYAVMLPLDTNLDDVAPMIGLGSPNHAPEASSATVGTAKNQPVGVTLSVYDADDDPLTYAVVSAPTRGTLSGTAPAFTYAPQTGFVGSDSFTFKANDAKLDSNLATITLAVTNPPVANLQSVTAAEDTPKAITLTATDADGEALTYAVATPPLHGTVTGTPSANVTYTPAPNYNGGDSFSFKANDGHVDSAPATVTINVTAVNDAPVANALSAGTAEDTAATFPLSATDVDGDALTYAIVTAPSHGTTTVTGSNATYTPAKDYNGPDSFTFKATDASLSSAPATVTVTVTPVNDPPVATAQSVTTAEDTAKAITLSATDVDGDALTYQVATPPAHGRLDGTAPNVTYTPAANYNGSDSFTFKASDASLGSAPATVSITITAVNDAPVATPQAVTTVEDTAKAITLAATDPEGDSLKYAIATPPSHGTAAVSANGPNATYTPATNYSGGDSFTFTAKDASLTSAPATVTISVTPVNDPPVATGQSVTTAEDTPKAITLTATDVDGDALTYVVTQPAHGTVTGTPGANVTYTPAANYNGSDSFTFKASDGSLSSGTATVSITVTAVNDPPVATPQAVTTVEDTSKAITLAGTDVEGSALTYQVATPPAHGTLSGTAPNVTYTPAANYSGGDTFTFTVSDGSLTSAPATVTISVTPVNDAPVASGQTVRTPMNTAVPVTLTATDPDNDPITYTVVAQPTHGTLSGSGASRTYTPATGYGGSDSFTFKVNDGTVDSNTATVTIVINAPPVAQDQTKTTSEDTALAITLGATDANGDTLTYSILTPPAHGALAGTSPNLTYTPAANYNGADSFSFKASDGLADSNLATVSLTIAAVNDAPVANGQPVVTAEDTSVAITLTASDVEGSPLTYAVVTPPAHGTLGGTAPNLSYAPAANYNGADSFTFKANDGALDSAPAAVAITVTPVNDLPVASGQSVATPANTALSITLTATDLDNDPLTYTVVTLPGHGTLTGSGASRTYTPGAGYSGADSFTFKVNDGKADSPLATVSIAVTLGPVCSAATANPAQIVWSPKHAMTAVQIQGVTGTGVTIQATSVWQDEPTNGLGDGDKTPDAILSPLQVRAERSGQGDGRIYHINFKATDSGARTCTGAATVCVPNDGGGTTLCVDGGALYDSTK